MMPPMSIPSRPRTLAALMQPFSARFESVDPQREYQHLVDDSRRVASGDLYLAIVGERVDGHRFVASALQNGAAAAIVNEGARQKAGPAWEGLPLIVVSETTRLRPQLAAQHFGYPAQSLRLVGLTGTNGKTTVNHIIGQIWSHAKLAHARLGTTGHWLVDEEQEAAFTTPFPLELQDLLRTSVDRGAALATMESSSHAIAQGRINGLSFDAIALTSFSQDHLDYHGDLESYFQAKLALCDQLRLGDEQRPAKQAPIAVAPIDAGLDAEGLGIEAGRRFLQAAEQRGARALGLSLEDRPEAAVACLSFSPSQGHSEAKLRTPWGELEVRSPLFGRFNLENLMCAAAITLGLGLSPQTVQEALKTATGAPGRLERVILPADYDLGSYPAVYVDYAHTPDAVARAAQTLRDQLRGRLIIVLGCGGDRDRSKRPQMAKAAQTHGDLVIATSDNPRSEDPESILQDMLPGLDPHRSQRIVSRAQAIAQAIQSASPQDRVLIAGKGHESYQIINDQTLPFDDREQAYQQLLAKYQRQ